MADPVGIGWLHLSDLAVSRQDSAITRPKVREVVEEDLRRLHEVSGPWDLVAISANITERGQAEEFERAAQVMDWLWTLLHRLGSEPSLVMVPGATDAPRPKRGRAHFVDERDAPRGGEADKPAQAARDLAEFTRFHSQLNERLRQGYVRLGMVPGDSSLVLHRHGLRVGILALCDLHVTLDDRLYADRIAAVCGTDLTEWARGSDAVLVVCGFEALMPSWMISRHLAEIAVPHVWLCGPQQQALTIKSDGDSAFLVIAAPQLVSPQTPPSDPFGYAAGRLWVTDDQPHVRVWHRCWSGDAEFGRLGPPEDAIVDSDGAVTVSLLDVSSPSPGAQSRWPVADDGRPVTREQPRDSPDSGAHGHRQIVKAQVRDLAWSPDGQRIAAIVGRGRLQLYRRDGTLIARASRDDARQDAIAWSPDGSRLATRSRSFVNTWTAEGTRLCRATLRCPAPAAMAWTPSGELMLGSDRGVCLWNTSDDSAAEPGEGRTRVRRVGAGAEPVLALALSPQHTARMAVGTSAGISLSRLDTTYPDTPVLLTSDAVHALAWTPDGDLLASGDAKGVVTVWDLRTETAPVRLEFLTDAVRSLSFSHDGKHLAATALNGSFCVWSVGDWVTLGLRFTGSPKVVAFSPTEAVLALGALDGLQLEPLSTFHADPQRLSEQPVVRTASAKVVLLGEGNVGKSCLALRLTQDRYEEIGSTHGMKFWSMPLERLDPDAEIPPDERREVVFWDMGGQHEYRLLHHAFLHDTMLALMVMEPRRGEVALRELEAWDRHLTPDRSKIKRILIGSKLDDPTVPRDPALVQRAMSDGRFVDYAESSARSGHGIAALRKAIARAIDWTSVTVTTRSHLFHRIRNHIELRRKARRIVIPFDELEELVRQREGDEFEVGAVGAVVEQLARQGLIADARLGDGSRMVILEVEQVERYAASLILAARDNPRGVPALELASVVGANMGFPRIAASERVPRDQELVIVECVIDLLIKSGICFRSGRLLIFPALFRSHGLDDDTDGGQAVAIAYDLVGPVDPIYSSLVCWLALGQGLGAMRLWEHRVEFAGPGTGTCGLRRVTRSDAGPAAGRFEVYFDDSTDATTRQFFAGVVDDFLRTQGVEMVEQLTVSCQCGHAFSEEVIGHRMSRGASDIGCPRCDARVPLVATGDAAIAMPGFAARIRAFRTETVRTRHEAVVETQLTLDEVKRAPPGAPGVRILHLSDLHISAETDIASLLQPLCSDLEDRSEGLGDLRPDLVVVSGDLTNRATPEEFEIARRFLVELLEHTKLTTERCIVVPGNHDLSWEAPAYRWVPKRQLRSVDPVFHVPQGDGFLVRSDPGYAERFRNFSQHLFHPLFQRPYSLIPEEQSQCVLYEDLGVQLLALNSAWQIDEYFPDRSAIHAGALARLLGTADEAVREARRAGRLLNDASVLRIGMWHHPITGNEKIVEDAFVDAIRRAGVRVCLHGHVHEDRAELLGHLHPTSRLHVIGAGSFGAPARERPESIPRLYNLLEIAADRRSVRVHTRSLRRAGGAWEPWYAWPGPSAGKRRPFYEIDLSRSG